MARTVKPAAKTTATKTTAAKTTAAKTGKAKAAAQTGKATAAATKTPAKTTPAAKTPAKKTGAKAAPAKAAPAKAKPAAKAALAKAAPAKAKPAAPAPDAAGPGPGDPAPAFSLPATGGRTASTEALKGKPFVVYFYPKADTPGCTTEACDFNEALAQFKGLGLDVIGISKDPIPALEKFAAKYSLAFPLASDPDNATAQAYGAWGEKVFMGRRSIGLVRSTFLVDKEGRIAKAWKKVKVEGHAAEVLAAAQALG
jgi:peroxiredoxin Q/BCP